MVACRLLSGVVSDLGRAAREGEEGGTTDLLCPTSSLRRAVVESEVVLAVAAAAAAEGFLAGLVVVLVVVPVFIPLAMELNRLIRNEDMLIGFFSPRSARGE